MISSLFTSEIRSLLMVSLKPKHVLF